MLHYNQGDAGACDLLENDRHSLQLARVQSGANLIHQQQFRLRNQGAGQIELLLLRAVETGSFAVRKLVEPQHLQILIDAALAGTTVDRRNLEIVSHCQALEWLWHLKGPVDAEARQAMDRQSANGLAVESHLSAIWRIHSGNHVDCGGLAGAVGTDQTDDLAARQLEGESIQSLESAEPFAQTVNSKQCVRVHRC
mgnify:CR=1 FL=1